MAGVDSTTVKKKAQLNARQRTSQTDVNEFQDQAQEMDALGSYHLLSGHSTVVAGMNVSHSSGYDFSVSVGQALWKGELAKNESVATVTLTENTDPNPRIDIIEITGLSETDSGSASKTLLSSLSRTTVTGEAVGTGDASTKPWDLDYAGVDLSTLKVYLGGVLSGGWSYSPETGTGSVDQIIFHDAPGSSVAITADYDYLSGGVEAGATVNTRKSIGPTFSTVVGTPAASPSVPSYTANSVRIATVQVPGSWTGGASGVTITNTVKEPMVAPDSNQVGASAINDTSGGRVIDAVRNIHQVLHGCRLQYSAVREIKVSAGWGVFYGRSFYFAEPITKSVGVPSASTWYYVYLSIPQSSAGENTGEAPGVAVSTNPPTQMMRPNNTNSYLYIGSFYSNASQNVEPFYTHGDHVLWENDRSAALTIPQTVIDLDVTAYAPFTGRALLVEARLLLTSSTGANDTEVVIATIDSHKNATGKTFPSVRVQNGVYAGSNSGSVTMYGRGIIRAEEDSGTMYVNYTTTEVGSPTTTSGTLRFVGYIDDYRTQSITAGADFY